MTKSHVGLGAHVCPVCGKEHDEAVLVQTKMGLPPKLTAHEFLGWKMCPEHQELYDRGFIALIEVSNVPTGMVDAVRTGQVAHIRAVVWPGLFDCPVPESGVGFAEVGLFDKLKQKMEDYNIMEQAEYHGH